MDIEEQHGLKIKLEKVFKPEIKRIFNSMLKDFKITLAARGTILKAEDYLPTWIKSLDDQYKRVQKSFLNVDKKKEDDNDEELLLLALLTWRQENKAKKGRLITETNSKQMEEALRDARMEFLLSGVSPTDRELALAATAILRKKFQGRVSSIALTETQSAAEATKFIKAEVVNGLNPTILGGAVGAVVTAMKKWFTMQDGKVRVEPFNHVAAHGQKVKLIEPFIVSGQLLNHPGDSSLGASIGNIAGCRCGTEYL